jgi:hypothetical protein
MDRHGPPDRTPDVRALLAAAGALIALGTTACGEREVGSSEVVDVGARGTTLVVRSIEQANERGDVTSEALRAIDSESGSSRKLPAHGFAGGDAQFAMIYAGRRLVFRCASGACVLNREFQGPPRPLGEAWCMAPSQTEGRVWLASLDPDSPETVRAMESVRELSVGGEVTVPDSRLPRGRWHCPLGAVSSGLLFAERPHGLVVWDPTEAEVVMRLPDAAFPAATYADLVAWCPLRCERGLHVTDVGAGEDEVVRPEDPFVFEETYEGAFSPDGSALAVPVRHERRRDDRRIAVVDVERVSVRVLPAIGGVESPLWSPDGEELFVIAGRGALAAYDLSSGEARRIELDPPTTILALVGG